MLRPLAEGRPARLHRYDWLAGEFAETVTGRGALSEADLSDLLAYLKSL